MGSMTVTTEHPRRRWHVLLVRRWLVWHGFCLVMFAGMLALGDWQLRRALSGNELSWAYTFEWPLFAIFGTYFWVRTCREELRHAADGESGTSDSVASTAAVPATTASATTASATTASATTADASPADAASEPGEEADQAYVARLMAEIQRDPRWRGRSRGRR